MTKGLVCVPIVAALCGCVAGDGDPDVEVAAKQTLSKDKCKPGKVKKKCTTTTATIGVDGGTITTPDGLLLRVPYGAVDAAVTLSVTATTLDPDPALGGAGTVYAFEPEGTIFVRPLEVSLPMPAGRTSGSVYWTKLNSTVFEPIGGTIANGKITTSTFHFSLAQVGTAADPVITGQDRTTWITEFEADRQSVPTTSDPSADIFIYLSNPDGTFHTPIPASPGDTPGEFKFANVGAGDYIVKINKQPFEVLDRYLVASGSTIDLGTSRGGKFGRSEAPRELPIDLSMQFAAGAWNTNSTVELLASQSDDFGFGLEFFDGTGVLQDVSQIQPSATAYQSRFNFVDAGGLPAGIKPHHILSNDSVVVAQLTGEQAGIDYQSMHYMGRVPSEFTTLGFTIGDPSSIPHTSVSVTTDIRATPKTLDVDFRSDLFWAAVTQVNPTAEPSTRGVAVLAQGYKAEEGFYAGNADMLLAFDSNPTQRLQTGPMTYGDSALLALPGGSWGDLFLADTSGFTRNRLPGTVRAGGGAINANKIRVIRSIPALGEAIVPPLTPPRNVLIDGHPFTSNGPSLGSHPTISWDPPATGKDAAHCTDPDVDASQTESCLTHYAITVREMTVSAANVSRGTAVMSIVTPRTSFQFPDTLDPSKTYTFTVAVIGGMTGNAVRSLRLAPFRATLDMAQAQIASGIFGDLHGSLLDVRTIAASQYPMGLAVTDTKVFWIEHGDSPWDLPIQHTSSGRLWRANRDGSAPEIVVDNLPDPQSISIDNGTVFWTNMGNDDGSIQFVDAACVAPCVAQTLIDHLGGITNGNGLVAKDGDVFWLDQGLRVIRSTDPCRTTAVPCAPELLAFSGVSLDVDAANVYWTNYGSGEVLSVPRGGGLVQPIANGGANPWDVHVGTGAYTGMVYYGNQAWQQPIHSFIDGVPSTNIADPSANHVRVATGRALGTDDPPSEIMKVFGIDATDAYYIDTYDRLMRAPLDGSGEVLVGLLPVGGCPQGNIVVRDRTVYWTDTCSQAVQFYSLP